MDRKELIDLLVEKAKSAGCEGERFMWQKQPYTMVVVEIYGEEAYDDFAFAKVQYPDEWDADYGVELATRKACAAIAKRILNGDI